MTWNIDELQLIHFADPVMRTKPPVFDFHQEGMEKAEELADVLHKKMLQLNGFGLSANQVGIPYRMFVFGNTEQRFAMFNPTVVGVSREESVMEEGCLSFPGFFLTLRRPEQVTLDYQDEKGETHLKTFRGIAARVILHEYDHMEGINFTYHASNFKLNYALNKIKKKQKKLLKRMGRNGK